MTSYMPSHTGYAVAPSMGQPYGMPGYVPTGGMGGYAPTGGVIGPTMVSALPSAVAPVVVQPSYPGAYGAAYNYGYGVPYNPYSWGNRFRRLLGLAPSLNVRYKHDRATWGFMGYSRRQRYIDPRTGTEVTRQGAPVVRM